MFEIGPTWYEYRPRLTFLTAAANCFPTKCNSTQSGIGRFVYDHGYMIFWPKLCRLMYIYYKKKYNRDIRNKYCFGFYFFVEFWIIVHPIFYLFTTKLALDPKLTKSRSALVSGSVHGERPMYVSWQGFREDRMSVIAPAHLDNLIQNTF